MTDGFLQHLKDTRYDSEQNSEKTIPCAKYSPLAHQEEKRLQEPKTRFSAGLSHLSSGFQKHLNNPFSMPKDAHTGTECQVLFF